jgi:hypothetical protein
VADDRTDAGAGRNQRQARPVKRIENVAKRNHATGCDKVKGAWKSAAAVEATKARIASADNVPWQT